MIYENKCRFCGKIFSYELSSEAYIDYIMGMPVQQAFPNVHASVRDGLVAGICGPCWSKTYHHPIPGTESDFGKLIGYCPICDCSIWECDEVEDGSEVYRCHSCKSTHHREEIESV